MGGGGSSQPRLMAPPIPTIMGLEKMEILMYNGSSGIEILPNVMPTHGEIDEAIEALRLLKAEWSPAEIEEFNRPLLHKLLSDVVDSDSNDTWFIEREVGAGYVYAVRCQKLYKIGRTKFPKQRLKKYRTENPYPVELVLVAWAPGYKQLEEYLLEHFKAKRNHGEWFDLDSDDLDSISQIIVQNGGMVMESFENRQCNLT